MQVKTAQFMQVKTAGVSCDNGYKLSVVMYAKRCSVHLSDLFTKSASFRTVGEYFQKRRVTDLISESIKAIETVMKNSDQTICFVHLKLSGKFQARDFILGLCPRCDSIR